jgi:hypothetical protein
MGGFSRDGLELDDGTDGYENTCNSSHATSKSRGLFRHIWGAYLSNYLLVKTIQLAKLNVR